MTTSDRLGDMREPQSAWTITGDLPCLGCGHNLRGLTGPDAICPECGHHNDLQNAEPWRLQLEQLGVRERMHWPSEAVIVATFGVGVAGLVTVLALRRELVSLQGACALGLLGLLLAMWIKSARQWVRSCVNQWIALLILAVLHVGAWATLVATLGVVIALIIASMHFSPPPFELVTVVAVSGVIGTSCLFGVNRVLQRGEKCGFYRDSPGNFRLPLGRTP